jgi:hypothetical protein
MIDKGIKYEDQRLTKKQKKKIKPANQGGGPNYLGKQKTVTVPKKWLSDPDHVVAELAYITPREKKILIDLDLYGSLNGKPNRGPAGIQSLQGDMGGFGGTGGPSGDNGGNGGSDNNHSRFDVGSGYYGETPTTPSAPPGGNKDDTREQYAVARTTTPIDEEVEVGPISEPERDTGLERARQTNIALADQLSKYTPPPVTLPTLGPFSFLTNTLLQGPLDAFNKFTAEKNIDFFQENVAGKYGYGYGIEDYEQYMDDRMSGKVGAYGNENMGQNAINERSGGDNRQDVSGILEALIQPVEEPEVLPKGFTYTPYSNQVVIAPGSQGLASLTGGQGFLQNII